MKLRILLNKDLNISSDVIGIMRGKIVGIVIRIIYFLPGNMCNPVSKIGLTI